MTQGEPTNPPVASPLPHCDCPLCGRPNQCAPAASGSFGGDCWCARTTVSAEALERVPRAWRGIACLCPACASGAEPDGPNAP